MTKLISCPESSTYLKREDKSHHAYSIIRLKGLAKTYGKKKTLQPMLPKNMNHGTNLKAEK